MMNIENSQTLFSRAQQSIPGGVNSPVRAFKSVGGTPLFIKHAKGAYLYDEDGNKYIDYINSWGPMIKGHAYEPVLTALQMQMQHSLSYGAPTRLEIEMAELIKQMVPNIEMVRMVNSGTEACMSALRLARGYTGKNKFIKFEGCYHGHADSFLVSAGSGLATFNIQTVPGVTTAVANDTLAAPYNNIDAVKQLFAAHKNEIAAIIVEPVAGNMGCVPPSQNFLEELRSICDEENALLIFDEVMTGFRLAPGGAQELYGVYADIVTFGKIIGGGLPVGAYGGSKKIMENIAPVGKIYQAGTLSGNPLAMRAGYTLLKDLFDNQQIYDELESKTFLLEESLKKVFDEAKIAVCINRVGSMISVHFSEQPITNFSTASAANNQLFNKYFHYCLDNGIYLPPSAFESWFVSSAVSEADIEHTIAVTKSFCNTVKG
jgi:glutamate-1-semialdehyde 2,1-aminomutase